MTEVIAFPSAEAEARGYLLVRLAARGDTAKVLTNVPATRPPRFVRLRRLGGVMADLVTDAPMLTVECWAPTEIEAEALARLVRAEFYAMPEHDFASTTCRDVTEVSGPVNQPDPDANTPRYVFTVILNLRGYVL